VFPVIDAQPAGGQFDQARDGPVVRCRLFLFALIIPQRMLRIAMREDRCPQLSVPIDAELKRRLEQAAAREDRPVASYVRRIVMKALDGEREGAAA
jgi:hypothetical protein